MTAAARPTVDRPAFLAGLRASGVLADARLDRALADVTFARTARDAAELLVASEALTRFQAERLLAGKSDGFAVGPYVILEHLGKTANGRVFKARHRRMNRLVAIEILPAVTTAAEGTLDAIRAEARHAAKLTHPNLITLLDVNQLGDRTYFVKEHLDGAAVSAVSLENGPLAVGAAADMIRQAALGLQHAHEKGVVHGHLSPVAILVGKGGGGANERPPVKVSGFGLGRFGSVEGTTAGEYRAPEPVPATPAADVYALGCVFFHLLAAHPPVLPVPPIRYIRPEVPSAVAALLAAMLATDPTARPTAEDVALRLSAFGDAGTGEHIDLNLPAASYSAATSILQHTSSASPFAGMTLEGDPHEQTPVAVPTRKGKPRRAKMPAPRGRSHPLATASVLLLVAVGVTVALTLMLKRALAVGH